MRTHKAKFSWTKDPFKLPMRSTMCASKGHYEIVFTRWKKVNCKECISQGIIEKKVVPMKNFHRFAREQ